MTRVVFYISLVILIAFSVNWKIGVIKEKRQAKVVSINNEYKQHGKPVEVYTVKRSDIDFYERVTGFYQNGQVVTFVGRNQWDKISVGQKVKVPRYELDAKVSFKSARRDDLTGLYKVGIRTVKPLEMKLSDSFVLDIKVGGLKDVLQLPAPAVKTGDSSSYVWVIDEDKVARKKDIKTAVKANNFFQIVSGVSEGEKVIVRGASLLEKGDQIRMIEHSEVTL